MLAYLSEGVWYGGSCHSIEFDHKQINFTSGLLRNTSLLQFGIFNENENLNLCLDNSKLETI